mmetsp:Transcript_11973/g.18074  ORF Transcript_11973/g.18074 Transcript_11973/m.18074 type:complete len:88 (-) Transcript_11973:811-1074(-)
MPLSSGIVTSVVSFLTMNGATGYSRIDSLITASRYDILDIMLFVTLFVSVGPSACTIDRTSSSNFCLFSGFKERRCNVQDKVAALVS